VDAEVDAENKSRRRAAKLQKNTAEDAVCVTEEKRTLHVVIPLELYITTTQGTKVQYRLMAVIKHCGNGNDTGHYIAQVNIGNQKWQNYNDAKVKTITEDDVLKEHPYYTTSIVFYCREPIA
jgi:ubiquitin C-terminal hydrolase